MKNSSNTASPAEPTAETKTKIDHYTAVGIAEGFIEADSEEQVVAAWQHLIDTGLAWQLQGFFGRTARTLIAEGICTNPI